MKYLITGGRNHKVIFDSRRERFVLYINHEEDSEYTADNVPIELLDDAGYHNGIAITYTKLYRDDKLSFELLKEVIAETFPKVNKEQCEKE